VSSYWRADGTLCDGSFDVQQMGSNVADAQTLWTPGMLYNGTTSDKPRGNTQGTLLASAARTSSATSGVQTNYNASGIQVVLKVTVASGVGGLVLNILGYTISGVTYKINADPTAVTAIGTYVYEIYPGLGAAAGQITQRSNGVLPLKYYVYVNTVDASSYTYQIECSLIL
jgi:hypothetical protein